MIGRLIPAARICFVAVAPPGAYEPMKMKSTFLCVDERLQLGDLRRDRLVAVHERVLAGDLAASLPHEYLKFSVKVFE